MGTVQFPMVTHSVNCTLHNNYHAGVTVPFKMLTHIGNCTLHNGYHKMGTVHFTMFTTQLELYTLQWVPQNGNGTFHNIFTQWEL